jgi:hypothetical protein
MREKQLTVAAAARRFNVAEGLLICIVNRESRWNHLARNRTSGAAGLFQQLPGYWPGRRAAYRRAIAARPALQIKPRVSVFNPRANVLVSTWMIASGGLSHWGGAC